MVGHDLVETLEQCLKMAKEARDSNKPKVGDMVYAWDNNPEAWGFIYGHLIRERITESHPFSVRCYANGTYTNYKHISKTSPI